MLSKEEDRIHLPAAFHALGQAIFPETWIKQEQAALDPLAASIQDFDKPIVKHKNLNTGKAEEVDFVKAVERRRMLEKSDYSLQKPVFDTLLSWFQSGLSLYRIDENGKEGTLSPSSIVMSDCFGEEGKSIWIPYTDFQEKLGKLHNTGNNFLDQREVAENKTNAGRGVKYDVGRYAAIMAILNGQEGLEDKSQDAICLRIIEVAQKAFPDDDHPQSTWLEEKIVKAFWKLKKPITDAVKSK